MQLHTQVTNVVNKAMTKLPDTSSPVRARLVIWFNEVARDILMQPRNWEFLETDVYLDIIGNQLMLPQGAGRILSLRVGAIFLSRTDQLTDQVAFGVDGYPADDDLLINEDNGRVLTDDSGMPLVAGDELEAGTAAPTFGDLTPRGFTVDPSGLITFHPGAAGQCHVKFAADLTADYLDLLTDTIFPKEFDNLFISGLRKNYYDSVNDPRFGSESAYYATAMNLLKVADNKRKPTSRHSRHGYRRTK